ncbi:anaerobic ribonucleoside-triphosphate reductase activating protein [Flaviflexus huanghaiensis]|uniref:anaerobic ribonucleoside-triphosphate reductase activating protein n=1 Tax=Flaviflexus huanghaiensis TaxID=1111473 RepID=UPI0015FDD66B|nr:anaerobic ribonucleoside-triphosphate reductase activating protein [Flaviflexus huanghaiensis]
MTAVAADLSIAGLVPLSTVDWPGRLAATVFLQGCPWSCGYCQNVEILDPRAPGAVPWDAVTDLLSRRSGLLDGVVFTGGEATRQVALSPAIDEVRSHGFGVGLHTAGAYPARLASLIERVDWVGLDIKALPSDYGSVVGVDVGSKAWDCLDIVLAADVDYEVRTTVHPSSPAAERFEELIGRLRQLGVARFALQDARPTGTTQAFQDLAKAWDGSAWKTRFDELTEVAQSAGFDSVEIRA